MRGWYSLALSSTGKKLSRPLRIADAPAEVGLVAVKAASKDQRSTTTADLNASGFVLVTTRPGANIEVSATVLGRHGELKAGPTVLAQEEADVLWVDAIATTRGWLVLWAVRRDDRADVLGIELSATGDHVGKSKVLVEGARAWQAAPVAGGAALGAVLAGQRRGAPGPVQAVFFDAAGNRVALPTTVRTETSGGLDLDMVVIGSSLVMGWSDRSEIETKVYVASLDARGKVTQSPVAATGSIGEEALIQLVPPANAGSPGYLVWENLTEQSDQTRAIRLAPIHADGTLRKARAQLNLVADANAVPEFGAMPDGLGSLTLAPACPKQQGCADAPSVPTYVQFDKKLALVASEPVRLDALNGAAASLSWSLTCHQPGCFSLAALEDSPATIFAVHLGACGSSSAYRPQYARKG